MQPIARIAVSLGAGIAVVCAVVVLNLPAFRAPPRP